MYEKVVKRALDILISFFALVFLSPVMLIVAIAIKCESKGPAIFKTNRVGRNNQLFKFYKFRSMRTDTPSDVAPNKLESDKYITKVGKFIRKTSIDELPQLWCILKGDMSIIGPRPAGVSESQLNNERAALGVEKARPGLTGLAQINGRDVCAADIYLKVKYDAEYCKKITFISDYKIFFKTISKVLGEDGIVEGTAVNNMVATEAVSGESILLTQTVADEKVTALKAKQNTVIIDNELQEVAADINDTDTSDIDALTASKILNNAQRARKEAIIELKENLQEVKDKNANDNIA